MLYQSVELWHCTILLQQHARLVQFFWSTLEFNFKWLMPIWHQAKMHQNDYSMNQKSLKNGRHASLEFMPPTQDTFQPIPGFINCARRWGQLSQATQECSQEVRWLAVSLQWIEGSMQCLSHNCPPDFSKPLPPVINHNCHMLSNDHVLVNNIYTAWTVNQGHRRWQ